MPSTNKAEKPVKKSAHKKQKSKSSAAKEGPPKESTLQRKVRQHPHFQLMQNGKIRCILTQHEFLPTQDNFDSYLKSKSYKKGLQSQFDLTQYEDFLITHRDSPHFLFCRLTGVKLPKKKTAIEKHVNSRKFKARHVQVLQEMAKREGREGQQQFSEIEQAQQQYEQQVDGQSECVQQQ